MREAYWFIDNQCSGKSLSGLDIRLGKWLDPVTWLAAQLRRRILSGECRPHDLLPSERRLAQATGIGRFHVRRALAQLEEEGWIERRQGHGTRVVGPGGGKKERLIAVAHVAGSRGTGELGLLLEGAGECFRRAGLRFDVFQIHAHPHRLSRRPPRLIHPDEVPRLADRYAGVLFIEVASPDAFRPALELERRRYPVVAANMERDLPVTGTRVDHESIFREAVETLVSFGHRRIAYVANPPDYLFYGKALKGYREGLAAAGIEWNESFAVFARTADPLGAYLAVQAVLDLPDRPTAIVAGRDYLAPGIFQAMEERRLVVGRDLSIISYDDLSWHVENPILTTFHEPCHEMGYIAAEMLLERVMTGWRPPEQRTLEAPLILRRTVGPPPQAPPEPMPPSPVAAEHSR